MKYFIVFACLLGLTLPALSQMAGGLGETKVPESQESDDVKIMASEDIQKQFAKIVGFEAEKFVIVSYSTQVVAGTNYFAKV